MDGIIWLFVIRFLVKNSMRGLIFMYAKDETRVTRMNRKVHYPEVISSLFNLYKKKPKEVLCSGLFTGHCETVIKRIS